MSSKIMRKAIGVFLSFALIAVLFAPTAGILPVVKATPIDFPQGFDDFSSIDEMTSAGILGLDSNQINYELNTNPALSHEGNNSIKTTFTSGDVDYNSNIKINISQPIIADGFSVWTHNPNPEDVWAIVYAGKSGDDNIRYGYAHGLQFQAGDSFTKRTIKFDDFGKMRGDNFGGIKDNTAPTKDIIAQFDYIEIRFHYKKDNYSVYMDSFDWVSDKTLVDFDNSSNIPSNVAVKGYLNHQENNFYTASIINGAGNVDGGNALKIDFGSVDNEAKEGSNDLDMEKRHIFVTFDVEGNNLNGDGLRFWLKNTGTENVGVRIKIIDKNDMNHRHAGGSYEILPSSGDVNNVVLTSKYQDYRDFGDIKWNVGSGTPSLVSPDQLRGAKRVELVIFPRSINNNTSLIIDGFSVVNPEMSAPPADSDISLENAYSSSVSGLVGLKKSIENEGVAFALNNPDFYHAKGNIIIPAELSIDTANAGFLNLDFNAPRDTKFKVSLLDESGATLGFAEVGIKAGGVSSKIPVSAFSLSGGTASVKSIKLEVADGFNNSYNFLRFGEKLTLKKLSFTGTDPGNEIGQNTDLNPAAIPQNENIGAFSAEKSYYYNEGGPQFMVKSHSGDLLTGKLTGIDFYNSNNYISLVGDNNDFLAHKDTGYFVFKVKAPRQTKLKITVYDKNWSTVDAEVGIVPSGADFVTVKVPLAELFSVSGKDFSQINGIRVNAADGFKNSVNFLNVGEAIEIKEMLLVKYDPGTDILQNKNITAVSVPAEQVIKAISSTDLSVVGNNSKLSVSDSSENAVVKVSDKSFYATNDRILLGDASSLRNHIEFGYFIFKAKLPRDTKLNLAFENNDGTVRAVANAGIIGAKDDFVTVKVPLKDIMLDGAITVNSLTKVYLEVNDAFKQDYNFLKVSDELILKDMKFIEKDSFPAVLQNKIMEPLDKPPKTPEDIEDEDSFLIFEDNNNPWTDANNDGATSGSIELESVGITKRDPDYEFFGKYTRYTVKDSDLYYKHGFPLIIMNNVEGSDRDMSYYLETATIRFWYKAEKDMEAEVIITNPNWQGVHIPVQLKASADGRFIEKQISFKEIYDSLPQDFKDNHVFTAMQVRIGPKEKTPESFLAKDESLLIARMEIWSKEAKVYNRFETDETEFHFTDGEVSISSYNEALAHDTKVEITAFSQTDVADWNVELDDEEKMQVFKTIDLYNNSGDRIQPKGVIAISFKIPTGISVDNLTIYNVFFDGFREKLRYVVEDDMITVQTYSAGTFMILEDTRANVIPDDGDGDGDGDDTEKPETPTGDNRNLIPAVSIIITSLGTLTLLYAKKRKLN